MSRALPVLALLVALAPAASAAPPPGGGSRVDPPSRASRSRYASAQAYYHALRAELAISAKDLPAGAEELQLALVYDGESPYLTRRLARTCLDLGFVAKAEKLAERAIALDAYDPEGWMLRAHVHLAKSQPLAAERAFRKALDRDPAHVRAAMELSRRLLDRDRQEEAIAVLAQVADRAPASTEPLAAIAEIERGSKRLPRAARALERAVERDPRSVSLTAKLVEVYERQARWREADLAWRRLIERVPDDVEALFEAARTAMWVDDDAAAERYVRSIQWMTRGPEIDHRLGLLYLGEGRLARAVALLAEAMRATPSDQRVRFTYGVALAQLGKDEAALAELELISPEHELYVEARVRISHLLLSLGRFDRAKIAVQSALERQPRAVPLITLLALIYERSGKIDEALRALREARKLMPQELELAEIEAGILLRSGERDRGMRVMRAAVEALGDRTSEDSLYRLAWVLRRAGDVEGAVEVTQRLLRESPDSSRALNFLGYLWAERGVRLEDAARLLRRALAIDPRSGPILDSLGYTLFRQGKLEEAERCLRRASHLHPNDPEIAEHLGDLLLARGKREEARAKYALSRATLERASLAREPDAAAGLSRVSGKLAELPGPARAEP